jgi:hypothetical protein
VEGELPPPRVGESGGCLASIVNVRWLNKRINGERCGGPTKYKGYDIYARVSFSMVVMYVRLLTKLVLIFGLG